MTHKLHLDACGKRAALVAATDAELAATSDLCVFESKQRQDIPTALRDPLQRSTIGQAIIPSIRELPAGREIVITIVDFDGQ